MVQDSTRDHDGYSRPTYGLTWKHVAQYAIGALETISVRLIDRGQAGAVLGLLATLGVMAVLLLVALRLPQEDIARAAADLTRSVWALSTAIFAATTIASLWTLRIHANAMRVDVKPLAKEERVRQSRVTPSEIEAPSIFDDDNDNSDGDDDSDGGDDDDDGPSSITARDDREART